MLTVLGYFVPNLKDIRYSILAEYSIECVKYYCRMKDGVKALYWSTEASKYLMKRFELRCKKREPNKLFSFSRKIHIPL